MQASCAPELQRLLETDEPEQALGPDSIREPRGPELKAGDDTRRAAVLEVLANSSSQLWSDGFVQESERFGKCQARQHQQRPKEHVPRVFKELQKLFEEAVTQTVQYQLAQDQFTALFKSSL